MKKSFILLMLITLFSFSCSTDDGQNNIEANLIGNWKVYERGVYEDNEFVWTDINANCINAEFRSDFTFKGNDFFMEPNCDPYFIHLGNWTKTENILNLVIQETETPGLTVDIDIDIEILQLSNSKMELKITIPDEFEDDFIFIHKYSKL